VVDCGDLAIFSESWLVFDCDTNAELDMNGDCIINLYEFSLLAQNWFEGIQ
jgi:hypothetical protein